MYFRRGNERKRVTVRGAVHSQESRDCHVTFDNIIRVGRLGYIQRAWMCRWSRSFGFTTIYDYVHWLQA